MIISHSPISFSSAQGRGRHGGGRSSAGWSVALHSPAWSICIMTEKWHSADRKPGSRPSDTAELCAEMSPASVACAPTKAFELLTGPSSCRAANPISGSVRHSFHSGGLAKCFARGPLGPGGVSEPPRHLCAAPAAMPPAKALPICCSLCTELGRQVARLPQGSFTASPPGVRAGG